MKGRRRASHEASENKVRKSNLTSGPRRLADTLGPWLAPSKLNPDACGRRASRKRTQGGEHVLA